MTDYERRSGRVEGARPPGPAPCLHAGSPGSKLPEPLDPLRLALHSSHYSRKTEKTYAHWANRLIFFHGARHPNEMGTPEVNAFLTHLAAEEEVSASTRNQALCALLFSLRSVLPRDLGELGDVIRARHPKRLPVVLTREEVKAVLGRLSGDPGSCQASSTVRDIARWSAFGFA